MKNILVALALAAVIISMAGCAAPVQKKEEVFFPPLPSLPRLQYLASFSGIRDIAEQSGFSVFVAGETPKYGIDKPFGVAMYDGKIYVCDTNSTVGVFDFKKKTFEPMSGAVGQGKLLQPTNIKIDKKGNKYVTDVARGQIVIFDANDAFVKAVGVPRTWRPTDAAPFEDRLYVADAKNGEIVVFDMQTLDVVKRFGRTGATDVLGMPTNLAFDKDGFLYVTDSMRFQVLKFDRDGHNISTLGALGDTAGSFARPRGLGLDSEKRLYVVDAAFSNIQLFDKEGRLLTFFGGPGPANGNIELPAGIAIDYDNLGYFEKYISSGFEAEYLVIVTSQFGKSRVNVFAFGKQKGVTYPTEAEDIEKVRKAVQKFQKQNPEEPGKKDEKEQERP